MARVENGHAYEQARSGVQREVEILNLHTARRYIESNTVRLQKGSEIARGVPMSKKCADGRVRPVPAGHEKIFPQSLGGNIYDPALVVASLNAALSDRVKPAQLDKVVDMNKIYTELVELLGGEHFVHGHTDERNIAGPGEFACKGCGHLNNLIKNPKAYGLTPGQAECLVERLKQGNHRANVEVLKGPHKESGVIIVEESNGFSVNSQHIQDGEMVAQAFVVDAEVSFLGVERLAESAKRILGVSYVNPAVLKQSYMDHAKVTLTKLASEIPHYNGTGRSIPVYGVKFGLDGTIITLEKLMDVGPNGSKS